jgi:hypothetical protein
VRRVLRDPIAVTVWLAVTLAEVLVAFVGGHAVWALSGWAVGGVIVAALKAQRRQ